MALFWISVILIAYVYIGYPLTILIIGSVKKLSVKTSPIRPTVTLIISAHNHEEVIERKINNALKLAYPEDKLQIIVVSAASTDRTDEIVSRFSERGVRLHRQPERIGKNAGLNTVVLMAEGEIIVFSNAGAILDADALEALVEAFADETVGCACGDKVYAEQGGESKLSLYQQYKRLLKTWATRAGSMIGADGAVFAIRKSLYLPLAEDERSDLAVPLNVCLAGFRVVFVQQAVAHELVSNAGSRFHQKSRAVRSRFATLSRHPEALNPIKHPLLALDLLSHRLLRRLVGVFIIIAFLGNISILQYGLFYRMALSAQILFYLLAGAGLLLKGGLRKVGLFSIPAHFCVANASALVGIFNYLTGKETGQ